MFALNGGLVPLVNEPAPAPCIAATPDADRGTGPPGLDRRGRQHRNGVSNPNRNESPVAIGLILFSAALATALVLFFLITDAPRKDSADERTAGRE